MPVPVAAAARGTCWRPPSEHLEDLEAPSAALPKDGEDGCRFGSDVSCFGMFWKSLIVLDGHIVMQNTIEHTNQIKPVIQPVQARLRSSSTMAAIPEAGRPSLCANQSYGGTACLIIMSSPWTHCTYLTCFELVSV